MSSIHEYDMIFWHFDFVSINKFNSLFNSLLIFVYLSIHSYNNCLWLLINKVQCLQILLICSLHPSFDIDNKVHMLKNKQKWHHKNRDICFILCGNDSNVWMPSFSFCCCLFLDDMYSCSFCWWIWIQCNLFVLHWDIRRDLCMVQRLYKCH